MPGIDGFEVCRQLRRWTKIPIIVLSVRQSEDDKIQALDLGADDYLAKPFSISEVVARVRALLRRASGEHATVMQVADLSLNVVTREALRAGEIATLAGAAAVSLGLAFGL